jgi:hypothetical protein
LKARVSTSGGLVRVDLVAETPAEKAALTRMRQREPLVLDKNIRGGRFCTLLLYSKRARMVNRAVRVVG